MEGDKICCGKLLALGVTVATIDFTMKSNCTSGVVLLGKPSNTISRPSYFPHTSTFSEFEVSSFN